MLALRVGIALIALSFVCWLGVPLAPVLAGASARAGMIAGASVAAAETAFWVGVALSGRPAWQAARRHGWRKTPRALWRLFVDGKENRQAGPS